MSTQNTLQIRRVAVLGAGVMGAQIAAHLVNANVQTILYDVAATSGDANGLVNKAIANLKKLKPSPLADDTRIELLLAANYNQHLEYLTGCDLIIEAVAEKMDIKQSLYNTIAPFIKDDAIFVTNTSGLSINQLAGILPEKLQPRFFGVHFFNPPRYMKLVELIAGDKSSTELMSGMEAFLVTVMGKGVIYAKDTPNFIANRIGGFSLVATDYHAQQKGISFDTVDALTGSLLGRPKSATYRTLDVVGLDTFGHVANTVVQSAADDPWVEFYKTPDWMAKLISQGAIGQKVGAGIYKKQGRQIMVLDLSNGDYKPVNVDVDAEVVEILKLANPADRFAALRECDHPQAQFLWGCYRDLFHYCAYLLEDIATTTRDIDLAMRWGYGWQQGPFEIWQQAGWQQIAEFIQQDIDAGKTMSNAPLPKWVTAKKRSEVYKDGKAFSASQNKYLPRTKLPVYDRQLFPDSVLGETANQGETILENDAIRLWHMGDDIAILSFKSKMNTIGDAVLDGILESVEIAEQQYKGLVIWQSQGDNFSVGANLKEFAAAVLAGQDIEPAVAKFQRASLALRYATVPTIAAIKGFAFGGGCEIAMHCDSIVAGLESYVGLVEVGVGLLPAGGGTKEFALKASQEAKRYNLDPMIPLQRYYKSIALGEVSSSARDAVSKGYLRETDTVLFNTHELLHVAKCQVQSMFASGYRPPLSPVIYVAGVSAIATFQTQLINMREGGFISDYDYYLGKVIAEVICGGNLERGTAVDEKWMLKLERKAFVEFANNELTQARIKHTLETGKPLRN